MQRCGKARYPQIPCFNSELAKIFLICLLHSLESDTQRRVEARKDGTIFMQREIIDQAPVLSYLQHPLLSVGWSFSTCLEYCENR